LPFAHVFYRVEQVEELLTPQIYADIGDERQQRGKRMN